MKQYAIMFEVNTQQDTIHRNQWGPILQGIFMRILPQEVSESLHTNQLQLYSQAVLKCHEINHLQWQLNLLDDQLIDMFEVAFESWLQVEIPINSIANTHIIFKQLSVRELTQTALTKMFYLQEAPYAWEVNFLTVTSFKQNGEYVLFPSTKLILQSLMNKYSRVFESAEYVDSEMLDDFTKTFKIERYKLQSQFQKVHGAKIDGFVGTIVIKSTANHTIRQYINMLLHFGELSGIGIKNAMGMGNIVVTPLYKYAKHKNKEGSE